MFDKRGRFQKMLKNRWRPFDFSKKGWKNLLTYKKLRISKKNSITSHEFLEQPGISLLLIILFGGQ